MATACSLRLEGVKLTVGTCLAVWLTVFAVANPVKAEEFKDVVIWNKAAAGRVLDVAADKLAKNGARLQLWDYNREEKGSPNQHWEVKSVGNGYHIFVCKATGKVLDARKKDVGKDGCFVGQWDRVKGAAHQEWSLKKVGQYYKIINRASGKVLDAQAVHLGNGCPIQLWKDVNKANQLWKFDQR